MPNEPAAVYVAVDELTPWADNPRVNAGAVEHVADSIKRFGFASPIIARQNGEVIAGHTRLLAAKQLGLDVVPVRYLDLDPVDAKLLALADNRVGEIADWDSDKLEQVLNELALEDAQLDGLGWSDDELAELIGEAPEIDGTEPEPDANALDEIPDTAPAITAAGDVVDLGQHQLTCGDCIDLMKGLPDNSVAAIVTDPPYGIGFMGKGWDNAVPGAEFAEQAYRVLKPGGHIIAFAATRTVHRLTVALEDAGLEVRDQIGWLQWQGFPKSLDVSKALDKKAGVEREVIGSDTKARSSSGASALPTMGGTTEYKTWDITAPATPEAKQWAGWGTALKPATEPAILCRKPLAGTVADNVLEHGVGGINVDGCRMAYSDPAWPGPAQWSGSEQADNRPSNYVSHADFTGGNAFMRAGKNDAGRWPANIYVCPKPPKSEKGDTNKHPTVKPVQLMRWLIRLVTPPGETVLEPFCGSGTTLIAAEAEGIRCVAFEREPTYCDIIRARYTGDTE
jgi:site-specific DNA-methyltransferase (adenine-specific)